MPLGTIEKMWSAMKSWLSPKPERRETAKLSGHPQWQLSNWSALLYHFWMTLGILLRTQRTLLIYEPYEFEGNFSADDKSCFGF